MTGGTLIVIFPTGKIGGTFPASASGDALISSGNCERSPVPGQTFCDLLHIAPHSSSSQLYRAKALLRKMIVDCRLVIIILLLLLVPLFYNYLPWKKKQQSHQPKMAMRQPKAEKRKEDRQTDSLEQKVCPGTGERSQLPELISASPLAV